MCATKNFQHVSSVSSSNCIKGFQAQIGLCITIKMHIKLTQLYTHKLKKISWKKSDKWETGRLGTSFEEQEKEINKMIYQSTA